jgi:MoaA/NifB/PqqE/SkfB family radical SAM enzyme
MNIFSSGSQKLLLYPQRIYDWQKHKPIIPITLEIQPSEQCNHNCPSCQSQYSLGKTNAKEKSINGQFLDPSKLDSIWKLPPEGIVLSGNTGDPLLHPKIDEIIKKIDENHIPLIMITNGQAITENLAQHILQSCRGLRISLDAADENSYSISHGVSTNNWNDIIEKISIIVKMKKNLINSNCSVGLGFLTSSRTKHLMFEAANLAKSLGVDYIQFRPYHYDYTDVTRELLDCQNLENNKFKIHASFQKYSRLGDCISGLGCQASWFYTVLDACGNLYICCHNVGKEDAKVGSLVDGNWDEFIFSQKRSQKIETYNKEFCIPNCRLFTQNHLLHELRSKNSPPLAPSLNKQIVFHAPFL